ncbi:MAG: uroporphyrinogen-III synthase [Gallionella sp.]
MQNITHNLPLAGFKVVVTRPRDQALKLAQKIEQAGGVPLLFPLLEITPVQDATALNEQVARLGQFNMAVFVSPNAVHYGVAAIRSSGAVPDSLKIATVGQGSAQALRESGITSVIAPTKRFDSEGLLALPELQHVAGWRVMIFRGDGGRELLGNTLKERGAAVEYASCYRRSKPQQDKSVLMASVPDAIIVTSSEALDYLWQMLDDNEQDVLRNTALFVPHARIARLAREQGWARVQVTTSGDDVMLSALITWAGQSKSRQGKKEQA